MRAVFHLGVAGLLAMLTGMQTLMADDVEAQYAQTAHRLVRELAKTLKHKLTDALDEQGKIQAVETCHLNAPDIVKRLSERSDWSIRRTSLKVRNLEDAPDKWELGVLKDFERRKAAGEPVDNLEHQAVVQVQGKPVFRYMRAIPVKNLCLNCHGEHLDSKVRAQLDSLYPFDQAIGFHLGDIRGAYSLSRPLEASRAAP